MRTVETQDWPEYVAFAMDDGEEVATRILCPSDADALIAGAFMKGVHRIERDGVVIYPAPTVH